MMEKHQRTVRSERQDTLPGNDARSTAGNDGDQPIPADVYPELDTDLARDNVENDLSPADRDDLRRFPDWPGEVEEQ
ncbi:MAG: hypothetical protein Q4B48_03390 [Syntrophomonadaceae bacterium]|nr:hypothetical protein [Syntrophomonadaceae bacterium]